MKNETFSAWALQDDKNRPAGMMETAKLRQTGADLPEHLPPRLPVLFPTAEVAEEFGHLDKKFRGMRPVPVTCDARLRAFVMVEAITKEGCRMCVNYKDEEDKGTGWQQSMPWSLPTGSGKSRFGGFSLN